MGQRSRRDLLLALREFEAAAQMATGQHNVAPSCRFREVPKSPMGRIPWLPRCPKADLGDPCL